MEGTGHLTARSPRAVAVEAIRSVVAVLILCGIGTVTLVGFLAHYRPEGIDDAWITYRYAWNLAHGLGYVYNAGQRVQGTSTPLYTLWLASMSRLGWPVPESSVTTALVAAILSGLVVYLWLSATSPVAGVLGAFLLVTNGQYMATASSGMETAGYVLLILLAFWSFATDRSRAAFCLAGLCLLMRLDGAAVLLTLTVAVLVGERRIPWRELLAPVALYGSWTAWSWWYFGSPIPQSLLAKQYHTGHRVLFWMPSYVLHLPLIYLVLAALGLGAAARYREKAMLALAGWVLVYMIAYTFSELANYGWYLAPPLVGLLMLGAYGLGTVARGAQGWRLALLVALFTASVLPSTSAADTLNVSITCVDVEHARWEGARYAAQVVPPTATLASVGIGMVGWTTKARIIDMAGLVTPATVRPHPGYYLGGAMEWTVASYRPAYVYEATGTAPYGLPALSRGYRVLAVFPHHCGGMPPFVLWQRVGGTRGFRTRGVAD